MNSLLKLTGIGLRQPHQQALLEKQPGLAWLEVHSENYFTEATCLNETLRLIREKYPISAHGVGLSIGSTDELNWQHLTKLKAFIDRLDPCLVSDHLSWSSFNGQYFHDLLPLPYTEEALLHVVMRVQQVQEFLQRQILLENVSSYAQFKDSTIPEWEFLAEVAKQSGCGILLDVNNVYVSASNQSFDPLVYLNALPSEAIQEYHLAGFSTTMMGEKEILVDTHSKAVVPAVWELFKETIAIHGTKPTIIEWDKDLPSLDTLCMEAYRAEQIMRDAYVAAKLTG